MKKLSISKTVLIAFIGIMTYSLGITSALAATQINDVYVSSVRVNDKDDAEFSGWYGVICFDPAGQNAGEFGDCLSGKVYCVTEGEGYGKGMMATALTAMLSGKKVNVRSHGNQCDMVQVHN
ncbi:MAG: hypothetical protein Q7S51_03720 [Gallionellaceae bacterium]|nr:hypothetical protein [Gallionellaceae bacterium]